MYNFHMIAMLAAAVVCQTPQPMDPGLNGLWADRDYNTFVIAAPFEIWATVKGRHFSLFSLQSVDNGGYYGLFDSSTTMICGWNNPFGHGSLPNDRQADCASWLSANELKGFNPTTCTLLGTAFPLPFIPRPETESDTGQVRITPGASRGVLSLNLRNAGGQTAYRDDIYYIGKSPAININGTYSDAHDSLVVDETGDRSRRTMTGKMTVFGKTYTFEGARVWTRGSFMLRDRDNNNLAGKGWIEWNPTPALVGKLKRGDQGVPTDRITIFLIEATGTYPAGATLTLTRSSQ